MEAIYFDNGSSAFMVTENNCIVVTYSQFNDKNIGFQPKNSFTYLNQYGQNRITKEEFDIKTNMVLTELQSLITK
jgi:hypothetical protein